MPRADFPGQPSVQDVAGYPAPLPLQQFVEHGKVSLGHLIFFREERFIYFRESGLAGGPALPRFRRASSTQPSFPQIRRAAARQPCG